MTNYSLTEDSSGKSLAIFYDDGDTVTIPSTHVNFDEIVDIFRTNDATDEEIHGLVNVMHDLGKRLSKLSERVSVTSYGVLFDGDPLRGELSDLIEELYRGDNDSKLQPLVNFLEKARTNPSGQSVDDLYKWITNGDLVITPNGDFVAYKGVAIDKDGNSVSVHYGTSIVNGVEHTGQIPNPDGAVVEMPRSQVDDNSENGCSTGLHAGTHSYASDWGHGRVLLVQINPRDVVSVPNDSSYQKLRVSRYTVLTHIDERLTGRVYSIAENTIEEPVEEPEDEPTVEQKSSKPLRDAFGRFIGKSKNV